MLVCSHRWKHDQPGCQQEASVLGLQKTRLGNTSREIGLNEHLGEMEEIQENATSLGADTQGDMGESQGARIIGSELETSGNGTGHGPVVVALLCATLTTNIVADQVSQIAWPYVPNPLFLVASLWALAYKLKQQLTICPNRSCFQVLLTLM